MVYTIEVFQHIQEVDAIVVVCLEDWIPYLRSQVENRHEKCMERMRMQSSSTSRLLALSTPWTTGRAILKASGLQNRF